MLHGVSIRNQIPLGYHQFTYLFSSILLHTLHPWEQRVNTHQWYYLLCPPKTVSAKDFTRSKDLWIHWYWNALAQQRGQAKNTVIPTEVYFSYPNSEYLKRFVVIMLYHLHSLLLDFCQATSVPECKSRHTYFPHTVPHARASLPVIHPTWRLQLILIRCLVKLTDHSLP